MTAIEDANFEQIYRYAVFGKRFIMPTKIRMIRYIRDKFNINLWQSQDVVRILEKMGITY